MILDAVPPGHEPTSISSTGNPSASDTVHAMNGIRINCRATPSVTGRGFLSTFLKSADRRVIPMPSITRPSKGTIYPLNGCNRPG